MELLAGSTLHLSLTSWCFRASAAAAACGFVEVYILTTFRASQARSDRIPSGTPNQVLSLHSPLLHPSSLGILECYLELLAFQLLLGFNLRALNHHCRSRIAINSCSFKELLKKTERCHPKLLYDCFPVYFSWEYWTLL